MEFRTCPNCGYKYYVYEYFKLRFYSFLKLRWNCKKCNTKHLLELKFNKGE